MRQIVSAALGAALCLFSGQDGGAARAEPAVLVELYTSQGCSSCPPADDYFADLAADPQVIALALHVDYWDYIGWADLFAQPQFTERQKDYARAIGSRTIYTPQTIVGGIHRIEGHQPEQTEKLIRKHLMQGSPVALTLRREGDVLHIRAETAEPLPGGAHVQLVRYRPSQTVTIERGENAGRTTTYHNIVTEWHVLGDWPGLQPLEMTARVPGADPAVVILQTPGPAAVLAVARAD
ncbi:MAG: DUF1223 domain-containing protein [Rhodobacterales bacterium]|nr:DUF1223 domain-containing protein [Rhodobacterales bacterium]